VNFPLDEERIDQIIFAMEDQQSSYAVDPDTGELYSDLEGPLESSAEGKRPIPIPEWGPVDGFQLMERFVAGLRNPLLREELREALSSGKGVFRKFKDILKTRREVEHLWFVFKEREMRRVVREWYNDERELAGLERLPEEPEESLEEAAELTAGDFATRAGEEKDLEAVRALDRAAFVEVLPEAAATEGPQVDPQRLESLYLERCRVSGDPLGQGSLLRVAETPEGEFAGFFWAVEQEDPATGRRDLRLVQLAVALPYRGIGLGALLLARLVREARDLGYRRLFCELSGESLRLEGVLRRLGFEPHSVLYELDPGTWRG
jgi:GNAT superfamily N-acetyltransferase